MQGLDPSTATFALPWWTALAIIALITILGALAGVRAGWRKTAGSLAQFAAVIGLVLLAWNFFDIMAAHDTADQRRAFQARLSDLNGHVLVPNSPLACLDALGGDALDEPCEKAIFANPESAAAAVSLMAERIKLLREGVAYASPGDAVYEPAVADLRRSLEQDRFGFVAQALATAEQCVPGSCAALSLLKNPERVAANLQDRTFEIFVGRHVAEWMGRQVAPALASAVPAQKPVASASVPAAQAGVTPATSAVNVDFPSAASIPPVSIMNAEPAGPPGGDSDPKAAASRKNPPAASAPPPRATARGGNAAPSTGAQ